MSGWKATRIECGQRLNSWIMQEDEIHKQYGHMDALVCDSNLIVYSAHKSLCFEFNRIPYEDLGQA